MANKVFVTGLALGLDNDACSCANYNIDWLFAYPTTLLWAEKIILTSQINEIITNGSALSRKNSSKNEEFSQAVKLIFEILRDNGLIEVVDTKNIIGEGLKADIYRSIDEDISQIKQLNENTDCQENCDFVKINDYEYCIPKLWTAYASIIYSRTLNANCLSSKEDLNFFDFKFKTGAQKVPELLGKPASFQKIFNLHLPNEPIGHAYLTDTKTQCVECTKEIVCKGSYLSEVEKNTKRYMKLRDRDEIQQLFATLKGIHKESELVDSLDFDKQIVDGFEKTIQKINRNLTSLLPKVERWSNFTTLVSIPITLAGIITKQQEMIIPGAAIGGLAKGVEESMKIYKNKFKWVNHLNSN